MAKAETVRTGRRWLRRSREDRSWTDWVLPGLVVMGAWKVYDLLDKVLPLPF